MDKLKLHSFGQNDHLESLEKKYDMLRKSIIENKKLTETEKTAELEILTKFFEKEKKNSNTNLY
jgi:hypothetical protein